MPDISTAVLSYLETLSCKDLIELIHSFMLTHEDIRLALEEKNSIENAKNKNDAVTVYMVCNSEIASAIEAKIIK